MIISLLKNGEWQNGVSEDKIILIDISRKLQTTYQNYGEIFKTDELGNWVLCDENTDGDWLIIDRLGTAWFGEKYHQEPGDLGAINLNSFGYINNNGDVLNLKIPA